MRNRLTVTAMILTLVAAICASPATASSRRLPKLITPTWSGIRPSSLDFSGDGGNIVTRMHWKSWTQTRAVGIGTSDIQGCVPNCAQGTETPVATRITFSNPVNGHFTKVVELRDGMRYTGYYRRDSWLEGAG